MLTQEQLADLRAKAEAATPGPWEYNSNRKEIWATGVKHVPIVEVGFYAHKNTVYIAAADPTTILQLLDMIEQLEKERDWIAVHAIEMNEYGDYWCPYRFMSQDKKCPMWTQGDGGAPNDDSFEAWKHCAFGYEESDAVNCGTDPTTCWKYVASKAVEVHDK